MPSQDFGYELPSREEASTDSKFENVPVKEGLYFLRILGADLYARPQWNPSTGRFSGPERALSYKVVFLAYSKADGRPILEVTGKEVSSQSRWIFKEFSPNSMGFTKSGDPSFMRALLCYCTGQEIDGKIKPPNFICVSPQEKEVTDEKVRQAVLDEHISKAKNEGKPTPLHDKGYLIVPDIRPFIGKYVQATVTVKKDKTGAKSIGNNVTALHELPVNFSPNEDSEKISKHQESYAKSRVKLHEGTVLVTNGGKDSFPVSSESITDEELEVDDIAL